MPRPEIYGWDIGGAHVKACRLVGGSVVDVVQWPCPLWLGMEHLQRVLAGAVERWPQLGASEHAVTMTGEMVDLFPHREDGVRRIAAQLASVLRPPAGLHCYAGDDGWCSADEAGSRWAAVASANWLATARHAALQTAAGSGVLIDIGSTTTDLVAFGAGRVLSASRSDADRLASAELVYQGVVRTPLCALAPRIDWRGRRRNVMNEFFASAADVYRLTGELDAAHDSQATADNTGKDLPATRQRLARMIGLDARDGTVDEWLALARAWRACQVGELAGQLAQMVAAHGLGCDLRVVSAGCGSFLAPDVLAGAGIGARCEAYGAQIARLARPELAGWAQVCAPCIAVAALFDREQG